MEKLFPLTVASAICVLNLLAYVFRRGQLDLTPTLMVIQMTTWTAYTILDLSRAYLLSYTVVLVTINLILSVAALVYWLYALKKTLRHATDANMQHLFGVAMISFSLIYWLFVLFIDEDNKSLFTRFYDLVPLRLNIAAYGLQRCFTYYLEGVQNEQMVQKVQKAVAS